MKRFLRLALGFVYLFTLLGCLVLLFKPGASIFYSKFNIDTGDIVSQGDVVLAKLQIKTRFYDLDSILFLQNGSILELASQPIVESGKTGTYVITEIESKQITILFSPRKEGIGKSQYSAYIHPVFISSNAGGILCTFLLLGIIIFFFTSVADPQKRKTLLGSPLGFVKVWLGLFEHSERPVSTIAEKNTTWLRASVNTVLIAFFYALMEWVFQVTKASFMDALNWGDKVKILMITSLIGIVGGLAAILVMYLLNLMLGRPFRWFNRYSRHIPAAFLTTCLALVMLDNFTYTVLKFGVVNSLTLGRIVYALLFIGFFLYALRKLSSIKESKTANILAAVLLGSSLILAGFNFTNEDITQDNQSGAASKHPNIILISTDGLNAENMSVYGYERETTPFIDELAKTSLVSQNNFTNAGHSMGSETALLTGKSPFTTFVLYPPDTLKGKDKYQHLPGLLKQEGYRTVELGVPYYVDANAIDFQNAFDAVNCKENSTNSPLQELATFGYGNEIYFFNTILGRIEDRFEHIFFIADMVNPLTQVLQPDLTYISDADRMACVFNYLDQAKTSGQPLFAHIHLMGTHGATFTPVSSVFSAGEDQTSGWMTDFYDDAILDFDTQVKSVVQKLQENGQYENTLLVMYTDHAQKYFTTQRLPLIIHFPNSENTGTITSNTQNMDIAPTLLDYLHLPIPEWMMGHSLLENLDAKRLIIAGATTKAEKLSTDFFGLPDEVRKPPFYQFNILTVVQCQNWYAFNLDDMTISSGEVSNYVDPCSADQLDSQAEIHDKVGELLTQYGFDLPDNW